MAVISEVADGIYLIDTQKDRESASPDLPPGSLVYFIAGDETALIEIGPAVVVPEVLDAIRSIGYDPLQLSYTIPTHIHLDHAGGVGDLARRIPKMKVAVHQRATRHMIDPSRLIEGSKQAFGNNFEQVYGPIIPIAEQQVHTVSEGESISIGKRELIIYEAPGHAPHHICIHDPKTKGVFSGEALGSPETETAIVLTVFGFDLEASLRTIDKMSKLDLTYIYCSNGGVCYEPAKLLESVKKNTKSYGEIILRGIKMGYEKGKIVKKLEKYQNERAPGKDPQDVQNWGEIFDRYSAYFKKKTMH